MKELSTEEKAKAYDEAKERMKDFLKEWKDCGAVGEAMEKARNVFPELKKSEDERIRKWLIRTLKSLNSSSVQIDGAYEMMLPAIAWLEAQGEQKPVISDDALREGIAHFGITQHQIDNWLKKYVDVEKQCEQDLEEDSYYFACKWSTLSPNPEVIEAFKAGAKWGKNQAKVEIQRQR